MSDGGTVHRDLVLKVLAEHGVDVVPCEGDPPGRVQLYKDPVALTMEFEESVGRPVVHQLQYRFGIPVHRFYIEV